MLRRWTDWRSRRYFEDRFRQPDPWALETSEYESQRLRKAIAVLGGRHFERALEIGCAEGQMSLQLADIATELLALDIAPTAVERARQRCAGRPNVRIECASICGYPMAGSFDLMVATEVLYYLRHGSGSELLTATCTQLAGALRPGGVLVITNWFEPGDARTVAVEASIRQALVATGLRQLQQQVHSGRKGERTNHFSLAVFEKAPLDP